VLQKLLQLIVGMALLILAYVFWLFLPELQTRLDAFKTERTIETALAKHDTIKATQLLEEAILAHPKEALFHLQLANQYHRKQQAEKAITQYRLGLRLNPEARIYRYNFARLLVAQHRPNDAIREYRTVLEWHPTDTDTLHDLGQLYFDFYQQAFNRGKVQESQWCLRWALYYFSKAIKLNNADISAWWGYGHALHLLKRPDKAKQAFCKVLAKKPDYTSARYNLGLILWEQHHEALAFELLVSAVRLKEAAIITGTLAEDDLATLQHQLAKLRNEYAVRTGTVLPFSSQPTVHTEKEIEETKETTSKSVTTEKQTTSNSNNTPVADYDNNPLLLKACQTSSHPQPLQTDEPKKES
jgi:Tfp pilus assembly protein PilF